MNVFILMLAVTTCYTITSLSDKYAVAEAKFTGNEFTFLMCSSMSVFIALSLPFQKIYFVMSWQAFAEILLVAVCKMLEFQMSALVLKQLSALLLITLVLLTKIKPIQLLRKNPEGASKVILARIPNAIGMLLENAIISISFVNYSFIQPMILVTLFIIGLIRREKRSRLNLIGSMICIVGIIAFQII